MRFAPQSKANLNFYCNLIFQWSLRMKLHGPRASQVSVAHHLNCKSYRTKMQEFFCGQLLQKLQWLKLFCFGKKLRSPHPEKLIPILNRLLRLLPSGVQIIQIPICCLHIFIIHTYNIFNNVFCTKQIHFRRFRHSFHHFNNPPAQLTDTIIQRGI